jgi:hypothetical protein
MPAKTAQAGLHSKKRLLAFDAQPFFFGCAIDSADRFI